jgi:hypothetical protein
LDLSHNMVRPLVRQGAQGGAASNDESSVKDSSVGAAPLPSLLVNWSGESRAEWETRLTAPPGKALVAGAHTRPLVGST